MNVLFVHDLEFKFKSFHEFYCCSGLDDKYFDRFFESGYSHVSILSRAKQMVVSDEIPFDNININLSKACVKSYLGLLNPVFYFFLIKELKISKLVVVSTPSVIGTFVTLICLLLRKPYTVEVAGDGDSFLSKKAGWIFSFFLRFMMPIFVRRAQGAAYVTKFLADKFPNETRIIVASNVNILDIHPKTLLSHSLIEKDVVKIGFVGGLNRRKGVDVLLQAASQLIIDRNYQHLQFHLVGGHSDFNLEAVLVDLDVRNYFVLHGTKSKADVLELMQSFDIYVQPSLSEGLPRATLEAMSCSLPVVATNLPGFYDILADDALVEPGNAADLATKIDSFLNSEVLCSEHSSRNLKVASSFLYDSLHQKRCEYYHSFIDNY